MYTEIITLIISSFFLTLLFRKYAQLKNVYDIPNARSSHTLPTPRGGGMAIVICFLASLVYFYFENVINLTYLIGLFSSGALVAFIGFWDDHSDISSKLRFLIHILASLILVYSLNGLSYIEFFGIGINLGWVSQIIIIFCLVGSVNLFNFMDGINGIAGSQVVLFSFVMALLLLKFANAPAAVYLSFSLCACSLGFLVWNFPVAKIFMGDAGSGFIGLMLGALTIIYAQFDQALGWSALIMLGVFIIDSGYTIAKRLSQGFNVLTPHRSHAYQIASRKYSHVIVTLSVICINIFWLAPIAYAVAANSIDGSTATIVAYLPLIAIAIYFKAGIPEKTT